MKKCTKIIKILKKKKIAKTSKHATEYKLIIVITTLLLSDFIPMITTIMATLKNAHNRL